MRQIFSGFGFVTGATYPFRAIGVIKQNPYLWGYLIMPILLNLVLFVGFYAELIWLGWPWLQNLIVSLAIWVDQLILKLPTGLAFLEYIIIGFGVFIEILIVAGLFILTGFIFAQFGVILGSPWYGKLSEQMEKIRTGQIFNLEVGIIRDIWRAIGFEVKKFVILLVIGLPLLFLQFLPGVGTLISTIGGVSLTALIVCLDFLDASLERRRFKFRQKLAIIGKSLPASAGFSLMCLGLISIPLINLVTIPLCVASGTLFFCDRIFPKLVR